MCLYISTFSGDDEFCGIMQRNFSCDWVQVNQAVTSQTSEWIDKTSKTYHCDGLFSNNNNNNNNYYYLPLDEVMSFTVVFVVISEANGWVGGKVFWGYSKQTMCVCVCVSVCGDQLIGTHGRPEIKHIMLGRRALTILAMTLLFLLMLKIILFICFVNFINGIVEWIY